MRRRRRHAARARRRSLPVPVHGPRRSSRPTADSYVESVLSGETRPRRVGRSRPATSLSRCSPRLRARLIYEPGGRRRGEHLTAMRRGGDAGRSVDIRADVALVAEKGCPRMESDANAHTVGLHRVGKVRCRPRERRAPSGTRRKTHHLACRPPRRPPPCRPRGSRSGARRVPPRKPQRRSACKPRRALDVREEEGDGAGRKVGPRRRNHASPSAQAMPCDNGSEGDRWPQTTVTLLRAVTRRRERRRAPPSPPRRWSRSRRSGARS